MRTGPVFVLGYGTYEGDDKQPMTRKDGSAVEFVEFGVDAEDRPRRLTLDQSVNGARAGVGEHVSLTLATIPTERAELGRSGRPYIKRGIGQRVVAFEPVKG